MNSVFVDLAPFVVQISLNSTATTTTTTSVDVSQLTDLVTTWMFDGFNQSIYARRWNDAYAPLVGVHLERINSRRWLRTLVTRMVTINYQGYTVWAETNGLPILSESLILGVQGEVLADPNQDLLQLLQAAPEASSGLGNAVEAVVTFFLPSSSTTAPQGNATLAPAPASTSNNSSNNDNVELIIIVAIVVAGLALTLLLLAILWAWRHDRKRRAAFMMDSPQQHKNKKKNKRGSNEQVRSPDGTGSGSHSSPRNRDGTAAGPAHHPMATTSPPPSEIEPSERGGIYADSVISEDISTSLSAYYRSGMASYGPGGGSLPSKSDHYSSANNSSGHNLTGSGLNDAASLSSMESYGYSLDGYASVGGGASHRQYNANNSSSVGGGSSTVPSALDISRILQDDE